VTKTQHGNINRKDKNSSISRERTHSKEVCINKRIGERFTKFTDLDYTLSYKIEVDILSYLLHSA
jgi:hypothetical protein